MIKWAPARQRGRPRGIHFPLRRSPPPPRPQPTQPQCLAKRTASPGVTLQQRHIEHSCLYVHGIVQDTGRGLTHTLGTYLDNRENNISNVTNVSGRKNCRSNKYTQFLFKRTKLAEPFTSPRMPYKNMPMRATLHVSDKLFPLASLCWQKQKSTFPFPRPSHCPTLFRES